MVGASKEQIYFYVRIIFLLLKIFLFIFSFSKKKHSLLFHLASLKRELGGVSVTEKHEGKRLKLDGGIFC